MKNDVKNNECCEDKARKCDNLGPSQPTSLKNLYNKFINMKDCKWKYYDNSSSMNFETFNACNAYDFILSYYQAGAKEPILNISFCDDFRENGKHEHTVSLYFFGCLFQDIISKKLEEFILSYSPNFKYEDKDFCYIWFLTCLYHDTAMVIEKNKCRTECLNELKSCLKHYNVEYNVFKHEWNNNKKPYTYSESLVKNYYKYRFEHFNAIDHGIVAGYLIYDRLKKNYIKAWNDYSENTETPENEGLDNFRYKRLEWKKEFMDCFAIVSDAIIAHNIWHSKENSSVYRKYNLHELIIADNQKTANRMNSEKNPLVFFLGLLDTIEPVKKFLNYLTAKETLEAIEIVYTNKKITISMKNNNMLYIKEVELAREIWFRSIKQSEEWLDITVSKNDKVVEIEINSRKI